MIAPINNQPAGEKIEEERQQRGQQAEDVRRKILMRVDVIDESGFEIPFVHASSLEIINLCAKERIYLFLYQRSL